MGDPPLALVYGAAALNAGFMSLAMPTRAAMTTRVISPELLPAAAALNQAMWNGAGIIGPALGGIVIGQLGLSWAYGIDVLSYVASLVAAFLVHSQVPIRVDGAKVERGFAAIREGLHYLKGKRVLQSTFTIDIVAMVFGMPRVVFPGSRRRSSTAAPPSSAGC